MTWTPRFLLMVWLATAITCFQQSRVLGQDPKAPFQLHPENKRYFLFRGMPTVLVTSAEHYGLLLNRAFDFEAYFDELASHGLNHTRVFSGAYREVEGSFGITENPLAPSDDDYICPWKRSGKTHRSGAPIFDLKTWDEAYFQRLDDVMNAASRRGIVVEMCLFSPMYNPDLWDVNPMNVRNNVNQIGDCDSKQVFTTEHADLLQVQSSLAAKITECLAPYDNVYIEICNEPYFGGVTEAWQRRIIDAVVHKQQDLGSKRLISLNIANKSQRIDDPHPSVSIFNFHYCHPPIVVAENAHVKAAIGENETGFRGRHDFLYRTEGWDFLVAGGAIYNNLDYSFSAAHPDGTLTQYDSPGGGSEELRQQLSWLKSTFERLPLPHVQPLESEFVQAPDGFTVSAIGRPGQSYLVYVHVDLPGRIKDEPIESFTQLNRHVRIQMELPRGSFGVQQIDTQAGKWSRRDDVTVDSDQGTVELELGSFTTDTALLIESR